MTSRYDCAWSLFVGIPRGPRLPLGQENFCAHTKILENSIANQPKQIIKGDAFKSIIYVKTEDLPPPAKTVGKN